MWIFWRIYNSIDWALRGLRCWFTGHDTVLADNGSMSYYEDRWCKKCWRENPDEENTLPSRLYFVGEYFRNHPFGGGM